MSEILEVRSYRHTYEVHFVDDHLEAFDARVTDQDFIVMDSVLTRIYPELATRVAARPHLMLEPTEEAKSYEGIRAVLERLSGRAFSKPGRVPAPL